MSDRRKVIGLGSIATVMIVATAGAPVLAETDFAQRNGEVEAKADLAAGRPLKIYVADRNGRIPMTVALGIEGCLEGGGGAFIPLHEADFAEGERYSAEQVRVITAASKFAAQYNRTIFRAKAVEVRRLCPTAHLANEPLSR